MENNLQVQSAPTELSVESVIEQAGKIQKIMEGLMKQDEHYGVIPGISSKKPSLFKAGAEKLCFTFRLIPSFEVNRTDFPSGHREYEIICTLTNQVTKEFMGQGVGICSSMESKYRYRKSSVTCPECGASAIIKGKEEYGGGWLCFGKKGGCGHKYLIDDDRITSQKAGKEENPDIADTYNTVLKMAKKRAHVDATITACAASDIFTQDLEDLKKNEAAASTESAEKKEPKPTGNNRANVNDLSSDNQAVYRDIMVLINKKDGGKKDIFPIQEKIDNKKKADAVKDNLEALQGLYEQLSKIAEDRLQG